MPQDPHDHAPGRPDSALRRHPADARLTDDEGPVHFEAPLRPPSPHSPAAPDADVLSLVLDLVISLRGWAELIHTTRARRYTGNPTAPGAINLGEVEKQLRQCANLADNHSDLLARDLRR